MKRKSNPISMFALITLIGLVSTFFKGDIEIGGFFENLAGKNLENLLEYLSLGLGFLTFASLFIILIFRASKGDKEYYWDFKSDDLKEDH